MEENVWTTSLLVVVGVSSLSGIGAATLFFKRAFLDRFLVLMISFAAGALLGDAFLHVIPEIAESERGFDAFASYSLLGGLVAFFLLEKVLHWHHAHLPTREVVHPVAVSNLVGDGLHNFLDGAIIAGAFIAGPEIGVATAIAVALHEIPQELGDFSILVHSGLNPKKALLLNLLTGLLAVGGAIAALTIARGMDLERLLLPFAAGAFIYIASTDLIPELHKEPEPLRSLAQVAALLVGVGAMAALTLFE